MVPVHTGSGLKHVLVHTTPEVEKFDFQASKVLGLGGRAGFRLGAEECEPEKRKGTV